MVITLMKDNNSSVTEKSKNQMILKENMIKQTIINCLLRLRKLKSLSIKIYKIRVIIMVSMIKISSMKNLKNKTSAIYKARTNKLFQALNSLEIFKCLVAAV